MVVDRIAGGFAVVEDNGEIREIPLIMLPDNVREGDLIYSAENGYIIDNSTADERRQQLSDRLENLFKGN